MTCISTVHGNIDHCSHFRNRMIKYSLSVHKPGIPCVNFPSVYYGPDSVSGLFLYVSDPCSVYLFSILFQQRQCNGMAGIRLGQSRQLKQLFRFHFPWNDLAHMEYSFCQCSRLIKHKSIHFRQFLKISSAFYKHSLPGCGTDPAQESKRYGYHQTARTRSHQKYEAPVYPLHLRPGKYHRRQNCRKKSEQYYQRSIIPRKLIGKAYTHRLFFIGILHETHDSGCR